MKKHSKLANLTSCRPGLCSEPDKQAGLTLLELMISLSLGLLLLTGIGTIYVGSNQTYRVQEQNARIQESGRYALEVLGRSLRQAGYWNISLGVTSTATGFGGVPINGLNTVCPTASPSTDVLTVQYDGIVGEQDCQTGNIAAGEFVQHTLFTENNVLRCNATRSTGLLTPPTACPTAGTGVELVSNVEDLQFLYGIDTDANQSADRYVDAGAVTAGVITVGIPDWPRVVSVRACVVIRSEEQGITSSAQSFLTCANALSGAGTLTAAGDSRLRRTFVATFNLRNRVSNLP